MIHDTLTLPTHKRVTMTRRKAISIAKQAARERELDSLSTAESAKETAALCRDLDFGRYAWVLDAIEAAYALGAESTTIGGVKD